MNGKFLACFLLAILSGMSVRSQGAFISLSPGECELCRTCARDVYEEIAEKWIGPTWILLPSGIEEIDAPVLRNTMGWELNDRKPIIADPELFAYCNPGARGYLTVLGPEKEVLFQEPLTNVVNLFNLDSLLPLLNQKWINAWLDKVLTVTVNDRYYSLLFNEPQRVFADSTILFFNESYLPWRLWKLKPDGNVDRFELGMNREQWNTLAALFGIASCSEARWEIFQKKLKRERLFPLTITNISIPPDPSRHFLCSGNFHALTPEGKELIFYSVIFELDNQGDIHNLRLLPDSIADTGFRLLHARIPLSQSLFLEDSTLHVRIFHPALIDRQDLSFPEDTLLPASARFSLGKSLTFEGFDSLFLPRAQIHNKELYFNSWSRFVKIAGMTGIIFLSVPDELQLSGDGFHRVSLQPTAAKSQLFHTFSLDMNVLARIVKEGDNFNLYLDKIDPERNSAVFSQKLALGMLLNPMFLYQEGKLYIVSSLPKKKMEIRSIPLRSPITN